jgi:hypothetical protein
MASAVTLQSSLLPNDKGQCLPSFIPRASVLQTASVVSKCDLRLRRLPTADSNGDCFGGDYSPHAEI